MIAAPPSSREVAWHEAWHTAALVCLGRCPHGVRVDRPPGSYGVTSLNWGDGPDRQSVLDTIVALIAGPWGDNTPCWPPDTWPINETAVAAGAWNDARQIRRLCELQHLDEVDYRWALFRAERLCRSRRFRCIAWDLAEELDQRAEVLDADAILRISEPYLREEAQHAA